MLFLLPRRQFKLRGDAWSKTVEGFAAGCCGGSLVLFLKTLLFPGLQPVLSWFSHHCVFTVLFLLCSSVVLCILSCVLCSFALSCSTLLGLLAVSFINKVVWCSGLDGNSFILVSFDWEHKKMLYCTQNVKWVKNKRPWWTINSKLNCQLVVKISPIFVYGDFFLCVYRLIADLLLGFF